MDDKNKITLLYRGLIIICISSTLLASPTGVGLAQEIDVTLTVANEVPVEITPTVLPTEIPTLKSTEIPTIFPAEVPVAIETEIPVVEKTPVSFRWELSVDLDPKVNDQSNELLETMGESLQDRGLSTGLNNNKLHFEVSENLDQMCAFVFDTAAESMVFLAGQTSSRSSYQP